MKNVKLIAIVSLLLLGVSGAAAQSLGDYARKVRKNKPEPDTTSRYYDNDNLPYNETLSVVGPAAGSDSANASPAQGTNPAAGNPSAAAAERQKTVDEWKQKIDSQRAKIDGLSRDLDLQQREYRLRAAAMYGDAGNRLRNAAQWDKEDAQYKSDVDGKQKAIDAARQELDEMQEQARKAGIVQKEKDSDQDSGKEKDNGKDKE
jgi:hypothetical protein